MKTVKDIILKKIGDKNVEKLSIIKNRIELIRCYYVDYKRYKKYSSVFTTDTFGKIESKITLRYHSLEKGFLYNPIRPRFAKKRVVDLIKLLNKIDIKKYYKRTQLQSALLNLCNYYDHHLNKGIDISDYYQKEEYDLYKQLLVLKDTPIKLHTKESFFKLKESPFNTFSISRASVRNFTGEIIKTEAIQDVVELANHAPSVCNRQPVNVHLVENKSLINKILEIQGGLKGYSNDIYQLVVLTSDRNYFYSIGERNQLYIDGGIYLMNLLYALHFYGIGACPAHWGMPFQADKKIINLLKLGVSEQIIALIAIGVPANEFSTTLSLRKPSNENLFIHN